MGFFSTFIKILKAPVATVIGMGAQSKPWTRAVGNQKTCAAIMDCTATHTAKGKVLHVVVDENDRIKQIKRNSPYTKLFEKPNPMMTGYDFIYALSWQLDEKNTALAWIDWGEGTKPKAIWPVYYGQYQLKKIVGENAWAMELTTVDGMLRLVRLEDVVILRQHYDGAGISGGSNQPIYDAITMAEASDQGLMNAIQGANRLHGYVKLKNALLSPKDVKANNKTLNERMKEAAENGGIFELDSTEDFTPVTVNTWAASSAQMKDVQGNLYDYFRTPKEVVNGTANEQTMQNYYEGRIEARWKAMAQAFTAALFTAREYDTGNRMIVSSPAATAASWATRMNILNYTKETGDLTTNERRELMGYPPVEGGDERQISLNYVSNKNQSNYQTGEPTPQTPPAAQEVQNT